MVIPSLVSFRLIITHVEQRLSQECDGQSRAYLEEMHERAWLNELKVHSERASGVPFTWGDECQ